jgi:hypothetical protein
VALVRPQLAKWRIRTAEQLRRSAKGRQVVRASGIVTHRQRPSTANSGVFATLEDETGIHARKFAELSKLLNKHQTLRFRSLTRPGWP